MLDWSLFALVIKGDLTGTFFCVGLKNLWFWGMHLVYYFTATRSQTSSEWLGRGMGGEQRQPRTLSSFLCEDKVKGNHDCIMEVLPTLHSKYCCIWIQSCLFFYFFFYTFEGTLITDKWKVTNLHNECLPISLCTVCIWYLLNDHIWFSDLNTCVPWHRYIKGSLASLQHILSLATE